MGVWLKVREALGSSPVVAGPVGGAIIYAERYLLHGMDRVVSGFGCMALVTQFGGSRVQEGETNRWRTQIMPRQALLVPPRCPTHWHYSGIADFAVFYMSEQVITVVGRLLKLTEGMRDPLPFSDALVGASALQILNELQKGNAADEGFMQQLADVMLEQAYRVLTTTQPSSLLLQHGQYQRVQKVQSYIRAHLAEDLSVRQLASLVGVSIAHFRRLFQQTLGVPVHRYIIVARLEQARTLLATTTLPIARIAEECGFNSQSHFTVSFRSAHGATPSEYRAQLQHQ